MEEVNKKYNIEIEILTPLSIGAGDEKGWVRGVDFVVVDDKLYKLNLKKMFQFGISTSELSSYFATKNEDGLKQKFAGKLESVSDFSIPFPVQSDNDVKTFVKNQLTGKPILTGSSLKGSVRSVLFQYLDGNSKDGKEVFGSSTEGDVFMRFIKVSDAEFAETTLVNTKIFNLRKPQSDWLGGWKFSASQTDSAFNPVGFNTLYECLMPNQKGYASLMMSEKLYDLFESNKKPHIKTDKKRSILNNDIGKLFSIINLHTKNYLEKEKSFFEKYSTDRSSLIISSIDSLLKSIPEDNSYCVLKMSAGSGFHSITGDWQFDDYTKGPMDRKRVKDVNANPKSRKIAVWKDNFSLMGFVKLRALTVDEYSQIEEMRKAEEQRILAEKRKEAEAIRLRLEKEEQARCEKEERNAKYNAMIATVSMLFDKQQYEAAWDKYREACNLYPECTQQQVDVELLETKVKLIQGEKTLEQHLLAEEEQRRQENAVPLEEKISKAQKIPTLCGNVKTWMKLNAVESLDDQHLQILFYKVRDIVLQMRPKEREKLNGLGKELSALVGPDTASRWYNEIVSSI